MDPSAPRFCRVPTPLGGTDLPSDHRARAIPGTRSQSTEGPGDLAVFRDERKE